MKNHLLGMVILLFSFVHVTAQSLYPVPLEERVSQSSLIVEGKVVAQKAFWNPQHTLIYTSNKIEVFKIFKGSLQQDTIEVLTVGGSINGESLEASDLLSLSLNETGIFFCFLNGFNLKAPQSTGLLYDVYASSQGFISYHLEQEKAADPFQQFSSITQELYPLLEAKTGRAFVNKKPSFSVQAQKQLQPMAVSITGFSPATVNAGALLSPANNLLTITGSGFGLPSASAAILFDDANNGTGGTPYAVAYNDPLVVSWTDVQIQVRVPTRAGSGVIEVRDAAGTTGASGSSLSVNYSILTASFTVASNNYTKESNLMNANSSGGYSVVYSTSTAGSGVDYNTSTAKATFQRALTTWNEVSGWNVIEGGTTTAQNLANDGVNIIMFDNSNTGAGPLAAGVLGVCYSWNSMCTSDPANYQARKTGFDIVVRNSGFSTGGTLFTVGPCPPNASNSSAIDLEMVLFHELGHALNLGHINDSYEGSFVGQLNPGKLMNYAVINSVKRVTPDYSAKAGAAYAINTQGNSYGNCVAANTEMTPLSVITESKDDCPVTFPATATPQNTSVSFDLVHATSNKYVDPAYTQLRCDGVGAAITNNAYYALRTSNSGGPLLLSVSGYTTNPASLTTCTEATPGIPVTGVRLALYQTSTCPTAGSFGTPVACRTITGDGSLTAINGLAANTNYLIMVEGIENTKASFNLVFSGGALPVKLTDFSGTVQDNHNRVSWKSDWVQDVEKMIVQKSNDGIQFETLTEIKDLNSILSGSASDYLPFEKTFYRLKIVNMDGSSDYSKIIYLQRTITTWVQLYPNPVRDLLQVQFSRPFNKPVELRLVNSKGQTVRSRMVIASQLQLSLPVSDLAAGVYQLVIYREDSILETKRVLVNR